MIDDKYEVERLNWCLRDDGIFPHHSIHGNYLPSAVREITAKFVLEYHRLLDDTATRVMQELLNTNSDALTSGRQTFCPFTGQSTTAAMAYKRAHEFITENLGNPGTSCLDWMKCIMELFEKDRIRYLSTEPYTAGRKVYDRVTKQNYNRGEE